MLSSAANPGVTIQITVLENEAFKPKLATAMQAGDPPDVFQSWGGGVLYRVRQAGLVQDITADSPRTAGAIPFSRRRSISTANDGKFYGVPWNMGMVVVWYNKALFTKAASKTPATWTEFLTTVNTLKEAGITPITVGEKDKWPGHFHPGSTWPFATGGKAAFDAAYTRDGSFADPPSSSRRAI